MCIITSQSGTVNSKICPFWTKNLGICPKLELLFDDIPRLVHRLIVAVTGQQPSRGRGQGHVTLLPDSAPLCDVFVYSY